MRTVFHIGYEQVALDRQGVTDLLTSPRVKQVIEDKGIKLISINQLTKGLPRSTASKNWRKLWKNTWMQCRKLTRTCTAYDSATWQRACRKVDR